MVISFQSCLKIFMVDKQHFLQQELANCTACTSDFPCGHLQLLPGHRHGWVQEKHSQGVKSAISLPTRLHGNCAQTLC